MSRHRICTRCIYDETVPSITFDAEGICNYCRTHDQLEREYPTGAEGQRRLDAMVANIRAAGRGKPYDCVMGVSGGCDSSFLLYKLKEMGLRPLAAHFDNTWNTAIATMNIRLMTEALDVDLFTHVVDNREYDDIYRAFLEAGVADIEAPTDIGLATTQYLAAQKYGIKYIIEGHSFRTEGISPLDWLYLDGREVESVHRRFGKRPMRTFPNLTPSRQLRHMVWNRFTAFYHRHFIPLRFGADQRALGYAALVRSGQMDREKAIEMLHARPYEDPEIIEIVELVKKRLGLGDNEFKSLMNAPKKTYRDYETYKKTFERLRPFFWLMYKLELVPKSFYMKYTRPHPP